MKKFIVIDLFNNGQNLGVKTEDELIDILNETLQTERELWVDDEEELSSYPNEINKSNYEEWVSYFAYKIKKIKE